MTFLDLSAVRKSYGPVTALDGVSLSVAAGSRTAIVGPSGSGKTTMLRIIAGFEAPDSGRVTMDGRPLAEGPQSVPAHQRGIGYVPQDGALFPHLSVEDNVGFGLPRHAPGRQERIHELMDMVALNVGMLQRRPHELSGGQQQRVALARALAQRPRLMLLDEPFSALDTGLRASTRKAVAQLLQSAGITTILVTHDQAEALSFADQVAVMRDGQLAQVGTPRELYQYPKDLGIANFLGEAVVLPAQVDAGWAQCALGRIPVTLGSAQGESLLMLRPEQLLLEETPPVHLNAVDETACRAQVLETDFSGASSEIVVRLLGVDHAAPLRVHGSGVHLPDVGAQVWLRVRGSAHTFSPRA